MNKVFSKKLLLFTIFLFVLGLTLIWNGLKVEQNKVSISSYPEVKESTSSATLGLEGQKVLVTRVVDGDTIEISTGQKVRYIGIDTPETVDPRRPVGCFGKEAKDENKKLVEGKEVYLVKDISETDKFGRLLRYVYLNQNNKLIFVNDYLMREGFAKASTYPPDVKYQEEFLSAEKISRDLGKGLWGRCI